MKYIIIIAYLICTTGGITFMKLGGDSLSLNLKEKISFGMDYRTFIGFLLYFCSFVLWQRIIAQNDISVIVPILTGIVQIIVLIIGILLLKENISLMSIIGGFLIIIGIIVMTLGSK